MPAINAGSMGDQGLASTRCTDKESARQIDLKSGPAANMLRAQGQRIDGQGGSMARRRYQQGRVFLRGKNPPKWIGRWREDILLDDGSVKRVERSIVLGTRTEFPTERLARRRLEGLVAPINSSDYRPGRVATLADFAETWQEQVLCQLKPTSVRAAKSHLKNHILPMLGRFRLDEIGREQQQFFVTRLSRELSRKTVLNVLGILSSMLSTAKKWGYVCIKVELGNIVLPAGEVKPEPRFFTPTQVTQILELAAEPFRTMFWIAAMTGVRAGELLGLKVEDLDFDRRLIFIRRSVNRGQTQTVKSRASQKPLPMPGGLAQVLQEHLHRQPKNAEGWLFVNSRSRPYSADKVVISKLWPILDALKIPRCGLHTFRHFHSSALLDAGASPQVAQAQLRHSDARITLEVYSHVIGDSQRDAVDRVEETLRLNAPKEDVSGDWIQ
jgi:integrase